MTDTQDQGQSQRNRAATPSAMRSPGVIALGGGIAAAVGSSFIPMNAIEGFVGAYGIAELLPAAAPPLGNTARLALSAGIGTLTAGALLALLPRGETDTMGFETAVKKSAAVADVKPAATAAGTAGAAGFGASKLAGWLRTLRFGKTEAPAGVVTDFADINRLRVRTSDKHPDAPARAPILASSDLGAPLDGPARPAMPVADAAPLDLGKAQVFVPPAPVVPEPMAPPTLRFAPPPLTEDPVETAPEPMPELDTALDHAAVATPEPVVQPLQEPVIDPIPQSAAEVETVFAPSPANADSGPELGELSLSGLLERLESGLARRRAQALGYQTEAPESLPSTGLVIPLAKPVPVAAEPIESPAAPDQGSNPLRFRLGTPPFAGLPKEPANAADFSDAHDDESLPLPVRDESWNGEVEYQQPSVTGLATPAASDNGVKAAAKPEEDDMDAALRDALATLRQLSDRQRNA